MNFYLKFSFLMIALAAASQSALSATKELGEIIVKFKEGADISLELSGFEQVKIYPELNAALYRSSDSAEQKNALQKIKSMMKDFPQIKAAYPDSVSKIDTRGLFSEIRDPLFEEQWNLHGRAPSEPNSSRSHIAVEEAWQLTKGAPTTVIAVLDLGFELTHPDLLNSWFVNSKEIPGNKKDDDKNGLVDDVQGWNFSINGPNLIFGQNSKHGTAVAGIIAATHNDIGVAGICPNCKILPIVVSGRVSEDAEAILYATRMGASILTNSWGYTLESPRTDLISDALGFAATKSRNGLGASIVFAMRNAKVNDCLANFPDISGHPNVIAVSSIDHLGLKVPESGFGKCTALVAPSSGSTNRGIATTDRQGQAGYNEDGLGNFVDLDYHNGFWGTSAAAPQVAGVLGLLATLYPERESSWWQQRVFQAAEKIQPQDADYSPSSGRSERYGFGLLNAYRSLLDN
jgi:subtilisin family serine protease